LLRAIDRRKCISLACRDLGVSYRGALRDFKCGETIWNEAFAEEAQLEEELSSPSGVVSCSKHTLRRSASCNAMR
jgi:molybdenum-dependent DNA-binding transcriptional regulator ModE